MKSCRFYRSVSVVFTLFFISTLQASAPDKVLFVGNSFSFYNNGIHNHYNSLIRANGDWNGSKNRSRLYALSGGHFHEHLSGLSSYLTEDKRGWHVVVLQGHSDESVRENKKQRFIASLGKAIDIVEQHNMQPILFMTWGYKGDAMMSNEVAQAYLKMGKKHDVHVVPVGVAFAEAEKSLPEIELFVPDVLGVERTENGLQLSYKQNWKHPSMAGTYLAACVFYASLQGKSPVGNVFTAGLPMNTANQLQQLSWQVVSNLSKDKANEDNS